MKRGLFGTYFVLLALVAFAAVSCEAVVGEEKEFETKEKTVLVYIAGNNSLASHALENIEQMKKGYIPDKDGNIVIYSHVAEDPDHPVLIHLRQTEGQPVLDTVYKFPYQSSVATESLTSAMKVTQTMFPADEMSLILWSHGLGWVPVGYFADSPSPDDDRYGENFASVIHERMPNSYFGHDYIGDSLNVPGMEVTALAKAIPYELEFLIFDACNMGNVEVAYQLRNKTKYVISSPTEIMGTGFPYHKIMQHIFKEKSDLKAVAQEYYNYYMYESSSRSGTISLVDCSRLGELAAVTADIFNIYRDGIISLKKSGIQTFSTFGKHWFHDFEDFINQLTADGKNPALIQAFRQALAEVVLYKAATPTFAGQGSTITIDPNRYCGLSSYITCPHDEDINKSYIKLDWNKDVQMIAEEEK